MKSWLKRLFQNKEIIKLKEQLRQLKDQSEADKINANIRQQELLKKIFGPQSQPNPLLPDMKVPLKESFPQAGGWPGFQSLINPIQLYYDGITPLMAPVPQIWDRTLNLGFYVTQAYLDILGMFSKIWYSTTPQVQGVIKSLGDYVIHTGFEYEVKSKPNIRTNRETIKKAQQIIDDFLNDNKWFQTERTAHIRLHRDGEWIPRLHPQDDTKTKLRTIENWQVRSNETNPESLFGVVTEKDDHEAVKGFNISYNGSTTDTEFVPIEEMSLIKLNTDKQVRRGITDFLPTQQSWALTNALFASMGTGETLRQGIAWMLETRGAASPVMTYDAPGTTNPFNVSPNPNMQPGQVPVADINLQFKEGPIGDSESGINVLQQGYQILSTYFRVPSWIVSGVSDANFAGSLVQESPFVRNCQSEQKFLKVEYAELLMKVLFISEQQELLPPGATESLMINVEATPLVVRQPDKETERNSTLSQAGLLSDQTWSVREELEFETEQTQIKEHPPRSLQSDGSPNSDSSPTSSSGIYNKLTDPQKTGNGSIK